MKSRSCTAVHPEPAATAWRCSECAETLTGLPLKLKRRGLCASLGEQTRSVECDTCTGRVSLKVYACPKRGETTLSRRLGGVAAVCDECLHWTERPADSPLETARPSPKANSDTFNLISPIGTGKEIEGTLKKKPWHYRTTAIIPHLNTPDFLEVVTDLLRLQTDPPYLVIVDTGSPFAVCDRIEQLRSEDLEIHYVRGNAYCGSSEPVTVALDVGFARANTPLVFLTHTDVFPMRRDAVQWLGDQCNANTPVVGWEMSERSWITDQWKGIVSHTFTMLHGPTMRKIGASWHMQRARELMGLDLSFKAQGWPDTETGFGMVLKAAGVPSKLIGPELNGVRQVTEWWDHCRSYTGGTVWFKGTDLGNKIEAYAAPGLAEAKRRIETWRRQG